MDGKAKNAWHTMHQHSQMLCDSEWMSLHMQSSLAWSCHCQLICFSKYHMCQWATVVNQPPFPPVFNMADNTLDGFDVSRVQGPTFWVGWNWQHPLSVGKNGINLPNNCKTNILRLLCFKFPALGNGNDDNGLKLPEKHLKLKLFMKVSMAPVSINKLLILLGKR